ncbi:MAG TPA: class I adenylate-forming enzyme family protein [Chthonomonadaceae bacterium]|nr:class I adenylate-forming enzyme family protein [Chthonomonadaceae bacterium]
MNASMENVTPDTLPLIAHARATDGPAWTPPFRNIGQILAARVAADPDKIALTFYGESGREVQLTNAELDRRAIAVAQQLRHTLNLQAGDRIATLLMNDWRTVLLYCGAWMAGVTVVPLNIGEDDERLAYILENSEARAVFTFGEQAERLAQLQAGRPELANIVTLSELAEAPDPNGELPDVPTETEALIVYTSGTTGAPKGVVLDQSNLIADAQSIAEWHRFGPDDRAMCVLPIHHVNGTVVTIVTPLFSGGSLVLNRRFHAMTFWQTLAAEGCTWVSVVPTVLAFLNERKIDLAQYDLSRFRHIICGAGPLTTELAHRFHETYGVRVVHGYGLSETTCYSCFLPIDLDPDAYKHWMFDCGFPSIGCPIPANAMAIHDEQGNALPPDARGEIVIRGYNVMRYYFKRPDANRDTFAHGWFRSGDEGFYRQGEDGLDYYFITGRLKELIIRGGINYSPFDIDEVLNAIPGIKAAMAVGFENNFYGEEIGAYVQLEEGATLTADIIIRACREKLPYSKTPKVVLFGTEFPVTSTGKYQRNKLKPRFAEWKDHQFREEKK